MFGNKDGGMFGGLFDLDRDGDQPYRTPQQKNITKLNYSLLRLEGAL